MYLVKKGNGDMDKMLKDMQMFAGMLLIALLIALIGTIIMGLFYI